MINPSLIFSDEGSTIREDDFLDSLPTVQISIMELNIFGLALRMVYNDLSIFPGLNTGLLAELGGGYYSGFYYKNPDGTDYLPPQNGDDPDLAPYNKMQIAGAIGIVQGLLNNPANKLSLVETFLIYRCIYQQQFQTGSEADALFYASDLYEKASMLDNEFITGLSFTSITRDDFHQTRKGILVELAFILGMPWFPVLNKGEIYYQLNFKTAAFWPFIDNDEITLTLADRFMADYCDGTYVPLLGIQRFGGRDYHPGLGSSLRGLGTGRYAGYIKMVNNTDLRLTFPRLLGYYFIPGIFGFFDAGASDNLTMSINAAGFFYSCGAGIYLHTPVVDLTYTLCYNITENQFPIPVFNLGFHF